MSITLSCPSCDRKLTAKEEHVGRRAKCPNCQTSITILKPLAESPSVPIVPTPPPVPVQTTPPPSPINTRQPHSLSIPEEIMPNAATGTKSKQGDGAGHTTDLKSNMSIQVSPSVLTSSNHSENDTMSMETMLLIILYIVLAGLCILKYLGMPWIAFVPALTITLIAIAVLLDKKEDKNLEHLIYQGDTHAMHKRACKHQNNKEWNKAKRLFKQLIDKKYPGANEAFEKCIRAEKWASYQCRFKNIFEAAKIGTVDDIEYFVEGKGVKFDTKNNDGWTPLHYAAQDNSNVDVLEYLISRGADVNMQVYTGKGVRTPLDIAGTEEKKQILSESGGLPASSLLPGEAPLPHGIGRISPPDYAVYLRVLDALNENGYSTYDIEDKSGIKKVSVSHYGHTCGWVFVVADPTPGLLFGIIGIFSDDFRVFRNSFTQYSSMREQIEIASKRFRRKAHKIFKDYDENEHFIGVYWPEGSNVGCYSNDPNKEYDVHEWLHIVREAMI